jgi:type I restriction enzyme, S subunit
MITAPLARVGDVARQIRGVTYNKEDASRTPVPGSSPVVRAGNITDAGLNVTEDLVWVPSRRIAPKQRIRCGDVVIATSSGSLDVVGKAAQAIGDWDGGFGAFCKVLRPNDKVEGRYFAHFFRTTSYRRAISALAAGANINNLRNEHLDDLLIPLPPLTEQRRIADILDRADGLRIKRRETLAALDHLIQALFGTLFGTQQDWRWPIITFESLLVQPLRNGISPSKSGKSIAKVLMLSAITGSAFDTEAVKESTFATDLPDAKTVSVEDFLICRGNGNLALVGRAKFPESTMPSVAFPDTMIAARCDVKRVSRVFLETLWNRSFIRHQVESLARTTNGTYKVNQTMLESIELPLPPIDLQRNFESAVRRIWQQRASAVNSVAQMDALFASLQHRAFRGEL